MRNFYTQVSDILGTLADIVQPRTFEELERYGFNASTADIILKDAKSRAARHKDTTHDLHAHFNEIGNSLPRQRLKPHRFIYRGPRSLNINIEADALREILRNLMDNAAKYCIAHDEIVGLVRETENHVTFSLSNVGPALSLQGKRRIFQRGFRGAHARRDDPTGSGLGLYYTRELCRLYDITLNYTQQESGVAGMSRHSFELLIPIWRLEQT
jgi:signal transduction histidine kinase